MAPKVPGMVPEDDPMWMQFWDSYRRRQAKKEARKAWAALQPSPELVQRILDALAWQFLQQDWVKDDHHYAPLPATYLRGERWEDEPPRSAVSQPWDCPHREQCAHRQICQNKLTLGTVKYPLKKAEAS